MIFLAKNQWYPKFFLGASRRYNMKIHQIPNEIVVIFEDLHKNFHLKKNFIKFLIHIFPVFFCEWTVCGSVGGGPFMFEQYFKDLYIFWGA